MRVIRMRSGRPGILVLLGLWLGCLVGCGRAIAATPAVQSAPTDLAAIDAYVDEQMAGDRVPRVALAIVRGEEIIHLRGSAPPGRTGVR